MRSYYIYNVKETVPIVMNYSSIYENKNVVNKLSVRYLMRDHVGLFSV